MIINGELPARFVWKDDRCVAFLSINPMAAGHTLVVPREEIDHWIDLEPDHLAHLTTVAQVVGQALEGGFQPAKVGMMIAGLEIPHVHVHIVPMSGVRDLDFANADPAPDPASLDAAAQIVRAELRALGCEEVAD